MSSSPAQRIVRALGLRSETAAREIDNALQELIRTTPQAASTSLPGSIDASQVGSGTFADARVAESNVTQHEAALDIDYSQLDSVPASFACDLEADGDGSNLAEYADDAAAASGGVSVGELYRTGSLVKVRVA